MDWFPFRNIKTSIQIAQFMRGHVKFIKASSYEEGNI